MRFRSFGAINLSSLPENIGSEHPLTIMLLHVLLLLLTSSNVHAVMNGNYILKSDMPNHPFRGAVQSGGGSGLIITTENDEAVVFTVAHGYDLKYTDPDSTTWMELMDYKKNSDNGLANAYGGNGPSSTYATSDGNNIIKTNLGLWRQFHFGDSESCPQMNSGVGASRTGALDDPYACDGLGPDIDLAMQRIRLTTAAQARSYPEIGLHFAPLEVGQEVWLAGFGRQYPCDWSGITNNQKAAFPEGLKTAKSVIRANFYSEAFTEGLSTTSDLTKFGCETSQSVNDCSKVPSNSTAGPTNDAANAKWGQGCSGDSGAAWMTLGKDGTTWNLIGVNRAAAKSKGTASTWQDSNFVDPFRTMCPGGGAEGALDDKCESTGTAISLVYPMRKKIKDALAAWGFSKKVTYECEPPNEATGKCQTGCNLCSIAMSSDCYPATYDCKTNLDGYPGLENFVNGDGLSTTTAPIRQCSGRDPSVTATLCRGLTSGTAAKTGPNQKQICTAPCGTSGADSALCDGHTSGCPGLTYCCGENPSENCGKLWKTLSGASGGAANVPNNPPRSPSPSVVEDFAAESVGSVARVACSSSIVVGALFAWSFYLN